MCVREKCMECERGRVNRDSIIERERERESACVFVLVRDGDCNQELLVENKMAAHYVHSLNTYSLQACTQKITA